MAWEHVQMTPLGRWLAQEGVETREQATRRLLAQLHADGFERTMEFWLKRLETGLPKTDAFSRTRARQFAAAAARFDQTGSRDVAEFVQFMERHVIREPEGAAVVRVMTIHKSKGLGFDVVILPDLEGKRIDLRRDGLAVQKAKDRTVEWIFDLPPKLFYEADEVLARYVRGAEADACYEALSLLYVALTRAKRAMYVLVEPVGKSASRNYPKLLAETLGEETKDISVGSLTFPGSWSAGNPSWHLSCAAPIEKEPKASVDLEPLFGLRGERLLGRDVLRPSADVPQRVPMAQVFSLEMGSTADFGAAVHALLAEVHGGELDAMIEIWRSRGVDDAVRAEAEACLRASALAEVWISPANADVWRERAFEIVLDGVWVTGRFDRVVVERGSANRAERVKVFDFKTDHVDGEQALEEAVRRHRAQLNVYRRVAATLAGVGSEVVSCELVFTKLQRRVLVMAS